MISLVNCINLKGDCDHITIKNSCVVQRSYKYMSLLYVSGHACDLIYAMFTYITTVVGHEFM